MGHIFHTPRPPIPKNCPKDNSRRNAGIPAKNKHIQYGTRKAPEKEKMIKNLIDFRQLLACKTIAQF